MAKSSDTAKVSTEEHADVVTISREEWEAIQQRISDAEAMKDGGANPAPAIEEGPHLKDPAVRAAKIEQLQEFGDLVVGVPMPDDMKDLLEEAGV